MVTLAATVLGSPVTTKSMSPLPDSRHTLEPAAPPAPASPAAPATSSMPPAPPSPAALLVPAPPGALPPEPAAEPAEPPDPAPPLGALSVELQAKKSADTRHTLVSSTPRIHRSVFSVAFE